MRTTVWNAVLVAGALAFPASPGGADTLPSADLALAWFDPGRALPSESARWVRREVTEQLREWGVRAIWREGAVDAIEPDSSLRVVILDRTTLGTISSNVLGTASLPGEVAPTAWVLLPNVASLLDRDRVASSASRARLARALARVTLHELIHLLAPRLGHARDGLMRASLRPADLVGASIPLDARSRDALLEAVARWEPRASAAAS